MALSRWSHSRWYIYETEDDCLQICGDGYVSLSDLKNNFDQTISSLTKDESEYDRQELICYLKAWIDFKDGNKKRGNNKINFLRRKGELRNYLNYRILPDFIKNDKTNPKEVWDFLENNKNKKITIDDLDSIYVKIEKVEKHKLGLYNIFFSFFNAKNIKVYDEVRMISSSSFLFKEYPLIEGESYLYNKKENFFINSFKDKEKTISYLKNEIMDLENKLKEIEKK